MPWHPGDRLGPYEIVAPLGAGGMGEVYRARDTRLGREVAVKVLPGEFARDPERLRRFEQEARAAAALNHPNILVLYDIGTHEGNPYIVTELLEGESLRQRARGGGLPPVSAVNLATQIAQGLSAAHEKGIVHRDLKPENLFVTKDGRVKILDFGLAKLLAPEPSAEDGGCADSVTRDIPTETGRVMGTIGYMAPEQARGEPADARSDVFSFGVVLYEMLAGKRPFERHSTADTFAALLKEDPPPLPKGLPSPLDRVVRRCLEKRPQDRYPSAAELTLALEALPGTALRRSAARVSLPSMGRGRLPRWAFPSALLIVLALAVGGVLIWRPWAPHRRSAGVAAVAGRAVRMAVLPFANLSGDPGQDYLSDGLTQEMISQLGSLHPQSLSVIARTSVMRYKKTETPIDQIGRELGVDYVLEGSEQRQGGRVRITAELVKVQDQTQLWSESYERELSDILALQSDVARKVAEALALKLLPAEQTRLASARSVNPEAYDAYLKAASYWVRLTPRDLDTAERLLTVALEKDPGYARGYAGMALVWACRQQMGYAKPGEAGPKARAAARRAVELDDSVAEAHFALADTLTWTDWNWAAAAREWERAVELGPGDAVAIATYSHYLTIVGRRDEAMRQIQRAVELDPFNVITLTFYSVDLYCARRYDEAIAQARKALALQPDSPIALITLEMALHAMGRHDEMIATAERYYAGWCPDVGEALSRGYAGRDYAGAWRRAAEVEAERHGTGPGAAIDIVQNYLFSGDTAHALDWLEKAYNDRDPMMPYLGCIPIFDPLRSEPRFQALLRKMNLPTEIPAGPSQTTRPSP